MRELATLARRGGLGERVPESVEVRLLASDDQHRDLELGAQSMHVYDVEARDRDALEQDGAGGPPVGIVKVLHKPVTPDRWRDALEDVVGPRR